MNDSFFTGKWAGAYVYGQLYMEKAGDATAFDLEITVQGGEVTGTCTDDDSITLFNRPCIIEGFVDENFISFVKRYPVKWEWDLFNNARIIEEQGHEVHYSGYFENGCFTGEWYIETSYTNTEGKRYDYVLSGNGTWVMEKVG